MTKKTAECIVLSRKTIPLIASTQDSTDVCTTCKLTDLKCTSSHSVNSEHETTRETHRKCKIESIHGSWGAVVVACVIAIEASAKGAVMTVEGNKIPESIYIHNVTHPDRGVHSH